MSTSPPDNHALSGNEMMKDYLAGIVSDMEVCSRSALEGIFGFPTFAPKEFSLSTQSDPPGPLNCMIESRNLEFTVHLYVSAEREDINHLLFLDPADIAGQMDAIGEIANTVAGSFFGRRAFSDRFGRMLPLPPQSLISLETSTRSWYIKGALISNSANLIFGFTARPNQGV